MTGLRHVGGVDTVMVGDVPSVMILYTRYVAYECRDGDFKRIHQVSVLSKADQHKIREPNNTHEKNPHLKA